MPFDPVPMSDGFRWEFPNTSDSYASSHRTIDPRQRANGVRRVSVRVTQAQYDQIVDRANSLRLTVAGYVRLVLDVVDVTDTPGKNDRSAMVG